LISVFKKKKKQQIQMEIQKETRVEPVKDKGQTKQTFLQNEDNLTCNVEVVEEEDVEYVSFCSLFLCFYLKN
jgi:hypothetical protein